jgi:hypothetical protein
MAAEPEGGISVGVEHLHQRSSVIGMGIRFDQRKPGN